MAENRKILYAASVIGHIARFHREYIEALSARGFLVDVMARGAGADIDIPLEKRIFSLKNLLCIPKIRKIIRRGGYSAVILNTALAAFYTRLACPRRGRPRIVLIVHGYLFSQKRPTAMGCLLLLAERALSGRTDAILTMNSEDTEIARKYRLTRGKIYETRGMGASVRPILTPPSVIRRELFGDSFVMTFVGELSPRKNQIFLIRALPALIERIPTLRLCLVGEGAGRDAIVSEARRLGVYDRVLLLGEREDACDVIRASDLYVSAARSEGMPFNVIEALGVGKTVLASRIKGHSDLISDGIDGFLFEPESVADFASLAYLIYCGTLSPDPEKIKQKYEKHEGASVIPDTLSLIEEALG